MKKNILNSFLFLSVFIFTFQLKAQNDTTEIIILHTNDMHAKIDQFSKLASLVSDFKNIHDNVLLFSAGDIFTGNPIVDQYKQKGVPMIDLMNKVGYDLNCLGNHEFDYGQKNLNILMRKATFPFLCANINISSRSDLKINKGYLKLNTNAGISIGVLGLIQLDDNNLPATDPSNLNGITFNDPIKTAKKFISYKDSSDIFIALTHLGFDQDKLLCEKLSGLDVIIGGHSHNRLQGGHMEGNILITQAGAYLDYVGVLKIKFHMGKVISKSDSLINLNSYEGSDIDIENMIKNYNENPYFDRVVGHTDNNITGNDELGALMTDAIHDTLKTDISFQNIGGIRSHQISAGDITAKQIYELQPFGNTFVVYKLKPKQIKKLIKYAYKLNGKNEVEVSGILIDLYINDTEQLKKVLLKTYNNEELENKFYTVAVNNFMAASYQLKFFKDGDERNIIDTENTINFLKKRETIDYKGVRRINTVKQ